MYTLRKGLDKMQVIFFFEYTISTQEWHSRLVDGSRAMFYVNISNFLFQKYLDVIIVKKYKNAMSNLQVSSHRLEVEIGRWLKPTKIPFDYR